MSRFSRWLFPCTTLTLLALALSLVPVAPALAMRQFRAVTDLVPQFEPGALQRTSIAPQNSGVQNDGRIELAPVGYIQTWNQSAFNLPENVTSHAAVELNGSIYVLGGSVYTSGSGSNSTTLTDHVWRGTPASNGDLSGAWTALASLPAVTPATTVGGTPDCAQTDRPLTGRTALAAASLSTGSNSGFIYAIGGVLDSGRGVNGRLPTSAVAIGQVGSDGTVTWRNGPCLPMMEQAASATIVTVQGVSYLYVVGGLEQEYEGSTLASFGSQQTYFARINTGTGDLTKDGTAAGWNTNQVLLPIPGSPPDSGVWNATLVASAIQTASTSNTALYLMGGQTIPGQTSDSATVYRGLIDAATGQVSWNTSFSGRPDFSATLNTPRRGLRAVEYNGNIMIIGGQQGDTTTYADVLSNQVDDNLELPVFSSNSNFYQSDNVLIRPRTNHAAVVVPVGTDHYVYVLAGQGDTTENSGNPTNTAFYGKIATDPNQNVGYATTGWYFSAPFRIDLNNAQLLSIRWDAVINSGSDIDMEYRTNNTVGQVESSWTPWTHITDPTATTTKSVNGSNISTLVQGTNFIYFEYRARFTTTPPGAGGTWQTPALNSVSIEVEVPGFPNLQVASVQPQLNGQLLTGLSVQIANRNPLPDGSELAAADDGTRGTFFVDVFITPGSSAVAPKVGQLGQVYAEVAKSAMTPNATLTITKWCETATNNCNYDITKQFPTPGSYTIYAIVDNVENAGTAAEQTQPCPGLFSTSGGQPCGNVIEADSPGSNGESDNISGPAVTTIQGTSAPQPQGYTIYMPLIFN